MKVTFTRRIVGKLHKFYYFVNRRVQCMNDFERCLNQGSGSRRWNRKLLVMFLKSRGSVWHRPSDREHSGRDLCLNSEKANLRNWYAKCLMHTKRFQFSQRTFSGCERNNIIHSEKGHVTYRICWMVTKALPVASKYANIFPVKAQKSQWIHNLFG